MIPGACHPNAEEVDGASTEEFEAELDAVPVEVVVLGSEPHAKVEVELKAASH